MNKTSLCIICMILALCLCACSVSDNSSTSESTESKTISSQPEKSKENNKEIIRQNVDVVSFKDDTLTVLADNSEMAFDTKPYYEKTGLKSLDSAVINNSCGIPIKAEISYYKEDNVLVGLDVIKPNGKELSGEFNIKSIADNIALIEQQGNEYQADIKSLAGDGYAVFDDERLKRPYSLIGIVFSDTDKCVVTSMLPFSDEKDGIKNYGTEESDIIPKYICAQVKSKDGAVVTATRNDNGQDVVFTAAMYPDGVSFNNDEHVFYALLSGNDADEKTSEQTMCVILPAGDITGEIIYTSTQEKTPAIYISYNGEQIKLETQTIIDKNGKQIDINDLKSGMSVTVNADDIRYMGSVYDKCYYVNSVMVE